MNASIPQVLACVDAAQAADGRTDEMIRDIASQIERQTDPDRAACFCRVIGARIRKEPLENDDRIMDIFHAPVIFSNLGSLNAESAAAHITGSEFFGCFASPVIFSLSTVGNSSYLTINQDFKGTQYLDAVEQVMGENGVGLSQTGRLADVPRFMDRMARIVRRYKDRTAVVDDQRSMTYGELDMESGKIYRYLKRKGVGRESMVQIVMPRCAGYYSCIAGILRAGAAYVPLEENYPEQSRWRRIILNSALPISGKTPAASACLMKRCMRRLWNRRSIWPVMKKRMYMMPAMPCIHPALRETPRESFMNTGAWTRRRWKRRKKTSIRSCSAG